MELEPYEALPEYSLQETTFYEPSASAFDLSMSSMHSIKSSLKCESGLKNRKFKKSVSFLPTFVQVSWIIYYLCTLKIFLLFTIELKPFKNSQENFK